MKRISIFAMLVVGLLTVLALMPTTIGTGRTRRLSASRSGLPSPGACWLLQSGSFVL